MKIIIFLLLAFSCYGEASAQDVYGRAKNPDTTVANPNDFNVGETIVVDTTDDGDKVFIGADFSSISGLPKKFIAIIYDTSSATTGTNKLVVQVIYNSTGANVSETTEEANGVYSITFQSGVFTSGAPKMNVIPLFNSVGDAYSDPTLRGYLTMPEYGGTTIKFRTVNGSLAGSNAIIYNAFPFYYKAFVEITFCPGE